jgi:hypothetical protein
MVFWRDHTRTISATRVVEAVVAGINSRDFTALGQIVADDVSYIDSMGGCVTGRANALLLLERLIAYDPGFRIHLEEVTPHQQLRSRYGLYGGRPARNGGADAVAAAHRGWLMAEWRSYSADNPRPVVQMLMGSHSRVSA